MFRVDDGRAIYLCEYLIQLGLSFGPYTGNKRVDTTKPGEHNEGLGKTVNGRVMQPPQPAFKRLHLLYVLSEAMCVTMRHFKDDHIIYIEDNVVDYGDVAKETEMIEEMILPNYLPTLVMLAGCTGHPKAAKTYVKIPALLRTWLRHRLQIDPRELMEIAAMANDETYTTFEAIKAEINQKEEAPPEKPPPDEEEDDAPGDEEDKPLMMPERHGNPADPNATWDELPAANGLYQKRVHGYPLRARALPPGGYPIRGGGE